MGFNLAGHGSSSSSVISFDFLGAELEWNGSDGTMDGLINDSGAGTRAVDAGSGWPFAIEVLNVEE